jgi:hypothetical protein
MKLLALDIGRRTGFAIGDPTADDKPRIGAVRLRRDGQGPDAQAGNLGCWLRDLFVTDLPDLIVAEDFMNPAASKSADATISQLLSHGALTGIAFCYGIKVERVPAAKVRKHFIGHSSGGDRNRTNEQVVKRAIMLGYLPRESTDWDRANAAGTYDYAATHFLPPHTGTARHVRRGGSVTRFLRFVGLAPLSELSDAWLIIAALRAENRNLKRSAVARFASRHSAGVAS